MALIPCKPCQDAGNPLMLGLLAWLGDCWGVTSVVGGHFPGHLFSGSGLPGAVLYSEETCHGSDLAIDHGLACFKDLLNGLSDTMKLDVSGWTSTPSNAPTLVRLNSTTGVPRQATWRWVV